MGSLTEFLYPVPARRRAGSIFAWWEKRRLAYNVAVGGAGLVTLGYAALTTIALGGWPGLGNFLAPAVAFGVMANVCYFMGSAAEIAIERIFGGRVLPTGPALYRMGLTFSVGLALFPSLLLTIMWVVRIVAGIF